MADKFVQIFEDMGVEAYDGFNSNFKSLSKNMHILTMLTLQDIPSDAKILCVGVGTGADIIELAKINKGWTFTGIDPAKTMLDGCKEKIKKEGLSERCDFFHGYLSDFQSDQKYDAAFCFFVLHFINTKGRKEIYSDVNTYLKSKGHFVHAEISFDQNSEDYPLLLNHWKSLHRHGGATEEKLDNLDTVLREQLSILSPSETKKLILECDFKDPVQFFQSFLIRAWHSRKN